MKRLHDFLTKVEFHSRVVRQFAQDTYIKVRREYEKEQNKRLEARWYSSRFLMGSPPATVRGGTPLHILDEIVEGPVTLVALRDQIVKQTDAWSATKTRRSGTN